MREFTRTFSKWMARVALAILMLLIVRSSAPAAAPYPTTTQITSTITLHPDGSTYMVGYPVRVNVETQKSNNKDPGTPTGTVTVKDSTGSPLCTTSIDTSGNGNCLLLFQVSGSKAITATYSGDANFSPSGTTSFTNLNIQPLALEPTLTAGRTHTCLLNANGVLECWGKSDNYPVDGSGQPLAVSNVVAASAGDFNTCALKTDGSIECWSDNVNVSTNEPAGQFLALSAGADHVCAIGYDEKLTCWGDLVGGLSSYYTDTVKTVSAGATFSCAIRKSDSRAVCWGTGYGSVPSNPIKAIAVGNTHTCAIKTAGDLLCWGSPALSPPSGNNYVRIESGSDYSCAQKSDGKLACWGSTVPSGLDQTNPFKTFSSGYLHTCALKDKGGGQVSLSCWGQNNHGQAPRIGITPTSMQTYLPKDRPFSQSFTAAGGASPYTFSVPSGSIPTGLALATQSVTATLAGTPTALGTFNFTLRATETFASSNLPLELTPGDRALSTTVQDSTTSVSLSCCGVSVPAGSPVLVDITVNKTATPSLSGSVTLTADEPDVTCTVTVSAGGKAQCALYFPTPGAHTIYGLYNGDAFYQPSPQVSKAVTIDPVTIDPTVSAGDRFNCSLDANGALSCWGMSDSGQTAPPSGIFNRVSAGKAYACGRSLNGRIYCWGWNGFNVATPPTSADFVAVTSGGGHACGLKSDNTVQCWGNPADGRTTPPVGVTFTQISAGETHTCGINSTTEASCWGASTAGQTTPPAGVTFSAISSGGGFSCGIRADNKNLQCWGAAPAGIPSGEFKALDAGFGHVCAIRESDNSIDCWGDNSSGQANDPSGSFAQVSAGYNHTCALRTDGFMLCWGANGNGQAPALNLTPTTLSTFDVNLASNINMSVSGGRTTLFDFSIPIGAPATGLAVDSSSGVFGSTALQPGEFNFTMRAAERGRVPALVTERAFTHIVRSDVSVAIGAIAPAEPMVGKPVLVQVSVAENPGGNMAVTPSLTVTVSANDGSQCQGVLSSGVTSCSLFFTTSGTKQLTATYTGDSYFKPGSTLAATEIQVAPFNQVPAVHTGLERTYVHRADGSLYCSGANCTLGNLVGVYTTVEVGDALVCVLQTDGKALCIPNTSTAYEVPGPFIDLSVGKAHACAINLAGSIQCWGDNASGQATPLAGVYTKVSAGAQHTCAIRGDQSLACWGAAGAINGIPAGSFKALAAGDGHSCAVSVSGDLACWGDNSAGESSPPGGAFLATSAGDSFSCAIADTGGDAGPLACWGNPNAGRTLKPYGSFFSLDSYADHSCALRGTPNSPLLACWGVNNNGEAPAFGFTQLQTDAIVVNQYWEHAFNPTGGKKPYMGGVTSGMLPPGINLGVTLSPAGVILYGTPEIPGRYPFTLAWRDMSPVPIFYEHPYTLTVTGADLGVGILPPNPTVALFNNELVLHYVITNATSIDVPDVLLSVELPAGLANVTPSGLAGCVISGATLVECPIASIGAFGNLTLTITGVVTATPGATLVTSAQVQPPLPAWPEIDNSDNSAELEIPVVLSALLFVDDFDDGQASPHWSAGLAITSPLTVTYLGDFGNSDALRLTLTNLPAHKRVIISYDLLVFGPWPGNTPTPGGIGLWEFGEFAESALLSTTFCNDAACTQSYPRNYPNGDFPAGNGAAGLDELGYPGLSDARYHLRFVLPHTSSVLDLLFKSLNLPPGANWGLDRVVITLEAAIESIYLPVIAR